MDMLVDYILPFLVILSVVVFVHELGHYWVARRAGVRVEVFSIGFGPEIWGWNDGHGTRWRVSLMPLGGYVRMFGEMDMVEEDGAEPRELNDQEKAVSFQHKTVWQRAAVVVAGPVANFLFAVVVFALLFGITGQPRPYAGIGEVVAGSAADEAGLRAGDRIVALGGQEITWFSELYDIVVASPNMSLEASVVRDGTTLSLTIVPKPVVIDQQAGSTIGRLGVRPDINQMETERLGPLDATWRAVEHSVALSVTILKSIGELLSGQRGTEELGGVLRIAQFSGQAAQDGLVSLASFAAVLSIHLCLINLFPIPMLDGGHLAFYLIEAVRGRPLGERAQELGLKFGLILVIALFVFATWNDLVHLRVIEFFQSLVS